MMNYNSIVFITIICEIYVKYINLTDVFKFMLIKLN